MSSPVAMGAYAVETPRDEAPKPRSPRRFKLVVGALLFCGVVMAAVGASIYVFRTKVSTNAGDIVTNLQQSPAIRLTLTAKRASMAFNGKTSAQIYVVPRASSSFAFDAILSQVGPDVTQTYLVRDNRAYYSLLHNDVVVDAGCLDASQLPPIELLESSLSTASVVDATTGDVISASDCPDGKLLHLTFAGEAFVFCNSKNNKLTRASSPDLDIAVEYLDNTSSVPSMDIPAGLSCPVVVGPSQPAPAATLLQTSAAVSSALFGAPRVATVSKSSCACKSTPKPCLFVHGVGERASAPLADAYAGNWGSIEEHAPCCSSIKFAHFDTNTRSWTNETLQEEFCDAAKVVSNSGSKEINSLLLVTYSMGNLIAGAAVHNNKCNFGKDVTWVSLAAPMQGSKTSNEIENQCAGGSLKWILTKAGRCPTTEGYLSIRHQSTVSAEMQAQFAAAQAVRAKYADRLLCGTNAFGITSGKSLEVLLVGKISHHDDPTYDGFVDFSSCSQGFDKTKFGTDAATALHYEPSINHYDSSFLNGDGWWGADRKPVKWFECAL
ncbi:hypothetical protein SDRG_12458 [Saprolegnia diclina VS20]|uniref:Uncharacterized protein n=1 Tax=Saprolegnia diclina (strain VS20) TaxID=1156394 RepID=T0PWN0_SAPDV|nr:hypothetical protein SDRG_12458 [Saprolegnia diclina VS20]EQC29914.1 hypothetical protein SDRG_12458 [Saprolegnia diclina VS20]|eukprot:XP_008616753.1 hypothetical protein SDRG_12458 [Saprolegnia diclina VS20]